MSTAPEFKRANNVTVHFEAGIAIANFYKTHDRLSTVRSDNPLVLTNGFVMPEKKMDGEKEIEVSGAEKLAAFKEFVVKNASLFGIAYDPIDRRSDSNKYPSSYDEKNFLSTAERILVDALNGILPSLQTGIDKLVADKHLPEGSAVEIALSEGRAEVSEKYSKGTYKYADAKFDVTLTVGEKSTVVEVTIQLVSGQIKKPREFGKDTAFTMTGVKSIMVNAGVLPKIEKPVPAAKEKAEKVVEQDAVPQV